MKTVNTNRLNQFWNEGVLPKINGLLNSLTALIDGVNGKIDVLDTKEEIEANTAEGKMAGALAVKGMFGEVNSKLANLKTLHLLGTASDIGSFAIPNYRDYPFLLFCTNGGGWHDSRMLPAKLNPTFLVTASTDTIFKVVHHSGTVTVSFQTQGSAPFGKIEVYGVL